MEGNPPAQGPLAENENAAPGPSSSLFIDGLTNREVMEEHRNLLAAAQPQQPKTITVIKCRTIQIGDYKAVSEEEFSRNLTSVVFCNQGLKFTVPHSINRNQNVDVVLPTDRVLQIAAHFRSRLPIILISTVPKCASSIRKRLGIGDEPLTNAHYFCSFSGGPCQRHIVLVAAEGISTPDETLIKKIFGKSLSELDYVRANDLYKRISGEEPPMSGDPSQGQSQSQGQPQQLSSSDSSRVRGLAVAPRPPPPAAIVNANTVQVHQEETSASVADLAGPSTSANQGASGEGEAVSSILSALQQQMRTKILSGVGVEDLLNRFVSLHQSNVELRLEKRILELQKEALEIQRQHAASISFAEFRYKEEAFRQVLHTLEQEFSCSICNEVFIEPAVVDCGHTYCNSCIIRARRANHDCPICRQYTRRPVKHVEMRNFITKLYAQLPEDVRSAREQVVRERNSVVSVVVAPPTVPAVPAGTSEENANRPRPSRPYDALEMLFERQHMSIDDIDAIWGLSEPIPSRGNNTTRRLSRLLGLSAPTPVSTPSPARLAAEERSRQNDVRTVNSILNRYANTNATTPSSSNTNANNNNTSRAAALIASVVDEEDDGWASTPRDINELTGGGVGSTPAGGTEPPPSRFLLTGRNGMLALPPPSDGNEAVVGSGGESVGGGTEFDSIVSDTYFEIPPITPERLRAASTMITPPRVGFERIRQRRNREGNAALASSRGDSIASAIYDWRHVDHFPTSQSQPTQSQSVPPINQNLSAGERLSRAIEGMQDRERARGRSGSSEVVNAAINRYYGHIPQRDRGSAGQVGTVEGTSATNARSTAVGRAHSSTQSAIPQRYPVDSFREMEGDARWRHFGIDSSDSDSDLVIWPIDEDPSI